MLKRNFMICALTICGVMGLQAIGQEIHSQKQLHYFTNKKSKKDLSPGALICNGKEDKCLKIREQEASASSVLFSVFSEDHEDEENLIACKECQ